MSTTPFQGSIVALVTPFKNGAVDEKAFQELVEWHVQSGTDGLVPVGTTGESPTLSHEEHERVVALCVEAAGGQVPVIAGAGSNSTQEAISLSRSAKATGADAVLVVAPYYNKPSQEGLYQHYKAIHDAADLPIFVYNIPGRSVVDISVETLARLFKLPQIVGVKDATGDLARVSRQRAEVGRDFIQLSGEDGTALAFNAHGGVGCISVTANVAPALCAQFQKATLEGRYDDALDLQDKLFPLHRALFCEPSPAPVKYALSLLGKCENELRLPLVTASREAEAKVMAAMKHAGLDVAPS